MSQKPNILFIMTDQLRYDCIGFSKNYPVKTPNIDKIASEGVWFNNAFTPIPLCCPARQALLNGRRPETFGGNWNYDATLKTSALDPGEFSWSREFQEAGYQMAYIGKWHVNPRYDPTHFGYDNYISERDYQLFMKKKYQNLVYTTRWFGEKNPVLLEDARTHWFSDRAIDIMKEFAHNGKPWHIRIDFPEPHLPCRPSGPFSEMYDPAEIPEWKSFGDIFKDKPYIQKQQLLNWNVQDYTWEDWAATVALYYGIISQVDDAVGKILRALEELGESEDTIIVFSADHGDMCGAHRMMDKHYVMYDDIVKVPLIVKWPGGINAGLVCDSFVSNCLDLAPTFLEMAGLETKDFFQGRSLMPLLRGQTITDWRQEIVSTYNGQQFGLYIQRMIRNSRWKYIWNPTDVDELYDMEDDPNEMVNLIHCPGHASFIAQMRKKLYEELLKDGDGVVANPWIKDQLLNSSKLCTR